MHPFLDRLQIPLPVQQYFYPFFHSDTDGNLIFPYGDGIEHFGFAFHRVPVSKNFWMAGNRDLSQVSLVIISGTALDCLAWLKKNNHSFRQLDSLLFMSLGTALQSGHAEWLRSRMKNKKIILLFGRDVLGRVTDLKLAAGIRGVRLEIYHEENEAVAVYFRSRRFLFRQENLSLSALDKALGFRFNMACQKPLSHNTFFDELLDQAGLLTK